MSIVIDGAEGTITVPAATLLSLVTLAAQRVDGARVRRARRHVEVEVVDGRVRVALELAVRYGLVLPDVARAVQQEITDALESMCGVAVESVDVSVEEVE